MIPGAAYQPSRYASIATRFDAQTRRRVCGCPKAVVRDGAASTAVNRRGGGYYSGGLLGNRLLPPGCKKWPDKTATKTVA